MPAMPFVLLVISLLFFLFSTRQLKLHWRGLIWFGGLVTLSWAAWFALSKRGRTGLFTVIGDFFGHLGNTEDSLLVQSISGNWPTVGVAIGPMFDAFLIFAALIAAVALIAFTPGEAIERAERPINIVLIGVIFGGLFALLIASIGFGGVAKRKVYMNTVSARDVIDGDTIRMGDVSLRLWGIDAPEADQLCRSATGEAFACGPVAGDHLAGLVAGKLVWCGPPSAPSEPALRPADLPIPRETYGRPIVMCHIRSGGTETDVAQMMARDGFAHLFEDADGVTSIYQEDVEKALTARAGLHAGDFLSPWLWRNDPAARCGFFERIGWDKLSDRLQRSCTGFAANDDPAPPAPASAPASKSKTK